uniref:Apyrase n=1 Tax=Caenorhabditis tropicalis TaxID=1561998 RepID=A0A1I7UAC9_9PELO
MWLILVISLGTVLSSCGTDVRKPLCEVMQVDPLNNSDILLPLSIITDMDSKSKSTNNWYSTIQYGALALSQNRTTSFIHWMEKVNITSNFNFNQKSMEMSDLKIYRNRLLSVDDKIGVVYWLRNGTAIPWVITSTGDGTKSTPFKGEWMTIRNNDLYLGSSGHEVVTATGEYINDDEMYIRVISPNGAMVAEDWTARFVKLRRAVGIHFPGFMIHEAIHWSEVHKKWFFLPRYASKLPFNAATVYETGANMLLSTSDCFCDTKVVYIGKQDVHRGFSAFQFIPGTNDEIIVALKTSEVPANPEKPFENKIFNTWITIFKIDGTIILEDQALEDGVKYEGIEFANVFQCL